MTGEDTKIESSRDYCWWRSTITYRNAARTSA